MYNCQGSRRLGGALGAAGWSFPCLSTLGRLWPNWHDCWAPAWVDPGREGMGVQVLGTPSSDRVALLVPRGPSTYTRAAWQGPFHWSRQWGRAANTDRKETEGQGASWAGSLRKEPCTCPQVPGKEKELWVSLSSFCELSGSVSFGLLLTDPKCQQQQKRGASERRSALRFPSRRGAALP